MSINPNKSNFTQSGSDQADLPTLIEGIESGKISSLSKAITILESEKKTDKLKATELLKYCAEKKGSAWRVGITGVPGVGKSTFINNFGMYLIERGHKVAVLAIDPSSQQSKGSILGDKTRMPELSVHPNAFVRPTPSNLKLGGVAQRTREVTLLLEAAGFDVILIETVGVGQSETELHTMTDFFLALMLPGAGDELQGIKRGILEMADLLVIHKADGDQEKNAHIAREQLKSALHYMIPPRPNWTPDVLLCSSIKKSGYGDVYNSFKAYFESADLAELRTNQEIHWFETEYEELLHQHLESNHNLKSLRTQLAERISKGGLTPREAAEMLANKTFGN